MRKNPKGVHLERWVHRLGCRRWFNLARSTVSHEILAVYKMGEPPPASLKQGEAKRA
jgi:heterotetrameric sarcosine oxidase delta subunit